MNLRHPFFVLLLLGRATVACAAPLPSTTQRADLIFRTDLGLHRFHVELANSERSRARGLMGRTKISADGGMLFIFDVPADHTFWMKDTPLSLDMVFVDKMLHVVGVIPKATPFSLSGRHVGVASNFVVELLGGTAERLHIRVGSTLEVVGGLPKPS